MCLCAKAPRPQSLAGLEKSRGSAWREHKEGGEGGCGNGGGGGRHSSRLGRSWGDTVHVVAGAAADL